MNIELDDNGLPVLDQFAEQAEQGLVNTIFKMSKFEESDNSYTFDISATYEGTVVGIGVEIIKGIKAGFDANMTMIDKHVYAKAVTFINTGKHSDAFLAVMAKLYGFEGDKIFMVKKQSYTAIALHQDAPDIQNQPIKMKIFGKDSAKDKPEQYNESYFIVDVPAGWVCWNEKDPEYREGLILGLLN